MMPKGGNSPIRRRRFAMAASLLLTASGAFVFGPALAQPVVQQLPVQTGTQSLNAALARLGRDPRDLSALIDAGNAALQMGDVDAAIGFFARADQISPDNMRVKAGLAGAMVRSDNPFDAIPLFAEAEKAGAMDPVLLSDRGLAYALVGDNASAERYYRQSLAARSDDETLRRLGLSQAISGDRAGMELTLSPLLQKQDKASWRTRAFALAILGRPEEAVAIVNQTMPADLASGIAPYLRYMPRLTPAQQAAAANFGRFPRAAEIGRDDPRVALYAPPKRVATADTALVPTGEPLGRSRTPRRDPRQYEAPAFTQPAAATIARSAPPEPLPTRQVSPPPALSSAPEPVQVPVPPAPRPSPPAVVMAPVIPTPVPTPPSAASVVVSAPPTAAPPAVSPAAPPAVAPALASASGFNLSRVSIAQSAAPAPVPAPAAPSPAAPPPARPVAAPAPAPVPVPQPVRPKRVADSFADFTVPTRASAPAPGAVDVRKIAAAKPKPVEPPKPVHPSRIWVQVGTGRDVRALGFTWRGLVKDNPDLFKGKTSSLSDWGRTNRLLTGPFASESAAETFLARLKKKGVDAFVWTSPAGQVVDDLGK